jgi:hypothetical protein
VCIGILRVMSDAEVLDDIAVELQFDPDELFVLTLLRQMALGRDVVAERAPLVQQRKAGRDAGLTLPVGGITAVRHVNWPVLFRAATLSARVAADSRARRVSGAPEWDELLARVAGPWQLDLAAEVDQALART